MERGTLLTAISYQRRSPSPTSEGVRPGVLSKGREGNSDSASQRGNKTPVEVLPPAGRGPSDSEHVFLLGTCSL